MAAGRERTTDAEIDLAFERAQREPPWPEAIAAEHKGELEVLATRLESGRRPMIPGEELQGREDASEAQWANMEIFGGAESARPRLEVDPSLPDLQWKKTREQQGVAA